MRSGYSPDVSVAQDYLHKQQSNEVVGGFGGIRENKITYLCVSGSYCSAEIKRRNLRYDTNFMTILKIDVSDIIKIGVQNLRSGLQLLILPKTSFKKFSNSLCDFVQ